MGLCGLYGCGCELLLTTCLFDLIPAIGLVKVTHKTMILTMILLLSVKDLVIGLVYVS